MLGASADGGRWENNNSAGVREHGVNGWDANTQQRPDTRTHAHRTRGLRRCTAQLYNTTQRLFVNNNGYWTWTVPKTWGRATARNDGNNNVVMRCGHGESFDTEPALFVPLHALLCSLHMEAPFPISWGLRFFREGCALKVL